MELISYKISMSLVINHNHNHSLIVIGILLILDNVKTMSLLFRRQGQNVYKFLLRWLIRQYEQMEKRGEEFSNGLNTK